MDIGEKISGLRKRNGMTQAELGEKLGVTYQAVSKWERNESLPDFDMMSKLAKLCGVSIAYFEEDGEITAAKTQSAEPLSDDVLGFCTVCGKIVRSGEESENTSKLVCKPCDEQQRKEREEKRAQAAKQLEESKRHAAEQKARAQYLNAQPFKRRSIIAGIVAGVVTIAFIIFVIIGSTQLESKIDVWQTVLGAVVLAICGFTWVFQLFWDGAVRSVTLAGAISLKLPGIIFTMDLDGLIFLVVMKIALWLLSALVAIVGFLFTAVLAMIISPFTFVPCIIKIKRCDDDLLD